MAQLVIHVAPAAAVTEPVVFIAFLVLLPHDFAARRQRAEVIQFSDLFQKINRRDKAQDRAILVTSHAVYNLKPTNLGSCKRRIAVARIEAVTLSEVTRRASSQLLQSLHASALALSL